jgi:hypothetical protein
VELLRSQDDRVAHMTVTAVLDRGLGKPREDGANDAQDPTTKIDVTKLPPQERE